MRSHGQKTASAVTRPAPGSPLIAIAAYAGMAAPSHTPSPYRALSPEENYGLYRTEPKTIPNIPLYDFTVPLLPKPHDVGLGSVLRSGIVIELPFDIYHTLI